MFVYNLSTVRFQIYYLFIIIIIKYILIAHQQSTLICLIYSISQRDRDILGQRLDFVYSHVTSKQPSLAKQTALTRTLSAPCNSMSNHGHFLPRRRKDNRCTQPINAFFGDDVEEDIDIEISRQNFRKTLTALLFSTTRMKFVTMSLSSMTKSRKRDLTLTNQNTIQTP